MLTVTGLSAGYSRTQILQDITLAVDPGNILCVLGSNGAGKTTLLRALAGTVPLNGGSVALDGVDLSTLGARGRARLVASVPQLVSLPEHFKVAEMVLMGRSPHVAPLRRETQADYLAVAEAMRQADVAHLASRPASGLSGGELQRVLIARALAQQPRVLLLDEATAHLDLKHQVSVLDLVRGLSRSGLIVVATIHDPNLAGEFGDRIALLREGRLLVHGNREAVLTPKWLQSAYDLPMDVLSHPVDGRPFVVPGLASHASAGR